MRLRLQPPPSAWDAPGSSQNPLARLGSPTTPCRHGPGREFFTCRPPSPRDVLGVLGWMPWAGATHQQAQPGSLSPVSPHNGPGSGSWGAGEPGGWESTARGFAEPCAGCQRYHTSLKAVSGAVVSGDANSARLCGLDPPTGLGTGCQGPSQSWWAPQWGLSMSPSPKVCPQAGDSHFGLKAGDATISPSCLGKLGEIPYAAQPSLTGASWPKMFLIPFLRLVSIPLTLLPPLGSKAAINSLNISVDAGAGCAKTPFLGPDPSWASAVLGCS